MMYDPKDILGAFVARPVIILGLLLRAVVLLLVIAVLLADAFVIMGSVLVVIRPLPLRVCGGQDLLVYIFPCL